MDWVLSWCVLVATFGWLLARSKRPRAPLTAIAIAAALVLALTQLGFARTARKRAESARAFEAQLPRRGLAGYASSDACRGCHPEEHESWHRTFHRTMTQVAT